MGDADLDTGNGFISDGDEQCLGPSGVYHQYFNMSQWSNAISAAQTGEAAYSNAHGFYSDAWSHFNSAETALDDIVDDVYSWVGM
jgi:hypothetical protein